MPPVEADPTDDDGETAIERAVLAAYPGSKVVRFSGREGAGFPLAGYLGVRVEGPTAHWLLVSRGLSELHEKEGGDPDVSGWGFELTCRVPARSAAYDFGWALDWMQGLAELLSQNRLALDPFHHMPMLEPSGDDEICALVFVKDVALAPSRSKNGKFSFLQMVGLTRAEHNALESWSAGSVVELICRRNPILLTDPKRGSYLRDPAFARQVEEGCARDGSSTGMLTGVSILWFQEENEVQIHLSADAVANVVFAVRHRLLHGRPMILFGAHRRLERGDGRAFVGAQPPVVLLPERGPSGLEKREGVEAVALRFDERAMRELLATLSPDPGVRVLAALPGVRFVVVTNEHFATPHYPW